MISDLLKPKELWRIEKDLLYDIKSYNLKSFFSLIDYSIANEIRNICRELTADPTYLKVCKPYSPNVIKLLDWPFINQFNLSLGDIREYNNDNLKYSYSTRYFVIKYEPSIMSLYPDKPYYIFPQHILPLLFEFVAKDLTNI